MNRSCLLTAPDPGSSKTKRVAARIYCLPVQRKDLGYVRNWINLRSSRALASAMPADPGSLQARPLHLGCDQSARPQYCEGARAARDEQNRVAEFRWSSRARMPNALHLTDEQLPRFAGDLP
jgi:hypothetical protein